MAINTYSLKLTPWSTGRYVFVQITVVESHERGKPTYRVMDGKHVPHEEVRQKVHALLELLLYDAGILQPDEEGTPEL